MVAGLPIAQIYAQPHGVVAVGYGGGIPYAQAAILGRFICRCDGLPSRGFLSGVGEIQVVADGVGGFDVAGDDDPPLDPFTIRG